MSFSVSSARCTAAALSAAAGRVGCQRGCRARVGCMPVRGRVSRGICECFSTTQLRTRHVIAPQMRKGTSLRRRCAKAARRAPTPGWTAEGEGEAVRQVRRSV